MAASGRKWATGIHTFCPVGPIEMRLYNNDFKSVFLSYKLTCTGLVIRGCQEPRAPLNSPAAPSNFCREPKVVLVSVHNTSR